MARTLERACFDYILLEDSSYVGESFGGSTEIYLKNGIAVPRQDPSVVAALMTQVTSQHRHRSDLRHLRLSPLSAGPPGRDARPGVGRAHRLECRHRQLRLRGDELRHAGHARARPALRHGRRIHGGRAAGLWGSWEPGAIIADRKSGVLVDHTKVHAVNYQRQVFQHARAAQFRPGTAGPAGDRPGRRLAARPQVRRRPCRHHRRQCQGHRGDARLSRRRAQAHGRAGPQACPTARCCT